MLALTRLAAKGAPRLVAARCLATNKDKISRSRAERKDSVTEEIKAERDAWVMHLESEVSIPTKVKETNYEEEAYRMAVALGLGRKRAGANLKWRGPPVAKCTNVARCTGTDVLKGLMPHLKHSLPECAVIGHANAGKSTLINALCGREPHNHGAASVSDRAGWTENIEWIRFEHDLYLCDLPGYGHAIATPKLRKEWRVGSVELLKTRSQLKACLVVVDVTRGICEEDRGWLQLLREFRQDLVIQLVLTKADLIGPEQIARAKRLVAFDVDVHPWPVSLACGTTGAGVKALIKKISKSTGINITNREQLMQKAIDEAKDAQAHN